MNLNTRTTRALTIAATALLASTPATPAQNQDASAVLLRLDWEANAPALYRSSVHELTYVGAIRDAHTSYRTRADLLITDPAPTRDAQDADAGLNVRFDKIEFDAYNPVFGAFSYSSEKPDEILEFTLGHASLHKQSFRLGFDTLGGVGPIRGHDTLLDNAVEAIPERLRDNFSEPLVTLLSPNGIGSLFDGEHPYLPEQPVSVDDTWERSTRIDIPRLATFEQNATYTLREIREQDGARIAVLSMTATGSAKAADPDLQRNAELKPVSFEAIGHIEIDLDARKLHATQFTREGLFSLTYPAPEITEEEARALRQEWEAAKAEGEIDDDERFRLPGPSTVTYGFKTIASTIALDPPGPGNQPKDDRRAAD